MRSVLRSLHDPVSTLQLITNLVSTFLGFGGKYVCRWLKEGNLDVGFTAHPSFVSVEELEGIKGPLSIAAAGKWSSVTVLCPYNFRAQRQMTIVK